MWKPSAIRILLMTGAVLSLTACNETAENAPVEVAAQTAVPVSLDVAPETKDNLLAKYPLRKQFGCLPEEAAFVAAHRGVSKGEGFAENSGGSLAELINRNILFAELDIAGLKDGTHILYHDGVWEEKSTGIGPIAASTWADAEAVLLQDTDGNLTSERPVKLADVLAMAKDKIYLEIDFKSSAKYEVVIDAIRAAGMADRVILIAYNEAQARRMAQLAPEMLLSVTLNSEADISKLEAVGVSRSNMNAWLGRGPYNDAFAGKLKELGIPVLAWPARDAVQSTAGPAALIVSDFAFGLEPIVGLSDEALMAYQACLEK